MTSAGYSSVVAEGDSADLHFQDTMVGGRGIGDPTLLRILPQEASQRLSELVELGALLSSAEDGSALLAIGACGLD